MIRRSISILKTGTVLVLTLGVGLGTAVQSHAQAPFDAHFQMNLKNGLGGTVSLGSSNITAFIGSLSFDIVNPVAGVPGLTDPFDAFCIDLNNYISTGTTYGTYLKSTDNYLTPKGAGAAWLYNNFVGTVAGNNEKSSGLQLAIWESIYDNAIDLDNGSFKTVSVDANAKAFANAYLTAWNGQTAKATWLDNYTLEGGKVQSLIGPARIPEPATLGLLALGGLAFAGYARRRTR
jgi:hypothetical protein